MATTNKMGDITAIVNVYKRPHTLDVQIEALRAQTIPPKCIFIWNNGNREADFSKYKDMPDVRVFDNSYNFGVWSRFLIGFMAPTEYICVFDDDTIPGNKWFENCLSCMKERPALYGTIGLIFKDSDNIYDFLSRRHGWDGPCEKSVPVDIVGHSWFFRKEWLQYFVREETDMYRKISNGEDVHFACMLQKYGNIPTMVPPHPAGDPSMWGSQSKTAYQWGCDGNSETGAHYSLDLMYAENMAKGFRRLLCRQYATSESDLAMFKERIRARKPFALIRPADGEYAVLQNATITNCDNWTFTANGKLHTDLWEAIKLAVKNCCYVGIPCECDNKSMAEWYYNTFKPHPLYTTFANIFVNANWQDFTNFLMNEKIAFTFIGPKNNNPPFFVEQFIEMPEFLVNDWDSKGDEYIRMIESLVVKSKNKIFLFSCGPIAKILVSKAWAIHPHNIYLDVGSSLDLFMKGSTNRYYTSGPQRHCAFTSSLIKFY